MIPSVSHQSMMESDFENLGETHGMICHRFRTSLTSVHAALKLLTSMQFDELSEDREALLSIAMNATNRLHQLIDQIEPQPGESCAILAVQDAYDSQLKDDFTTALNCGEFLLHYQPIIAIEDRKIVGFEALARWEHPIKGLIAPKFFIPLAEKTGLIQQLGLHFLAKACQQLHFWQQEFSCALPLSMSVNISPMQLAEPNLSKQVYQILKQYKILPNTLKLEVTESIFMDDWQAALRTIRQLKELGIKIHLDDFGTGYSSLSRLQRFPFDALKIDRSFVFDQSWIMTEVILMLASRLQLEVIAEGIETLEQLQSLRKIGCTTMQGYYFSKPINSTMASQLLAQGSL